MDKSWLLGEKNLASNSVLPADMFFYLIIFFSPSIRYCIYLSTYIYISIYLSMKVEAEIGQGWAEANQDSETAQGRN